MDSKVSDEIVLCEYYEIAFEERKAGLSDEDMNKLGQTWQAAVYENMPQDYVANINAAIENRIVSQIEDEKQVKLREHWQAKAEANAGQDQLEIAYAEEHGGMLTSLSHYTYQERALY